MLIVRARLRRSDALKNVMHCRSISNFVTAFHKKKLPLHILANNAAVWMVEDQMTEDGFEVYACALLLCHAYVCFTRHVLQHVLGQHISNNNCLRYICVTHASCQLGNHICHASH